MVTSGLLVLEATPGRCFRYDHLPGWQGRARGGPLV